MLASGISYLKFPKKNLFLDDSKESATGENNETSAHAWSFIAVGFSTMDDKAGDDDVNVWPVPSH